MDSATKLPRKAFDSCKLFVYIWLLGALPPDPTGTPPLDPAGGLPSPRPPVPTLTSEPGYATGSSTGFWSVFNLFVGYFVCPV